MLHYILKLPGTIAQVVDYPTPYAFEDMNMASLRVIQINNSGGHSGVRSEPIDFPPVKTKVAANAVLRLEASP